MAIVPTVCLFAIISLLLVTYSRSQDESECNDRMDKVREFYCVSQCIGVSDVNEPMKRAAKTQPLATGQQCNGPDYTTTGCCDKAPDFFAIPSAVRDSCSTSAPLPATISKDAVYSDFILNKWLEKDNWLDIMSVENVKKHQVFCYAECLFKSMNWTVLINQDMTTGKYSGMRANELKALWKERAVSEPYMDIIDLAVDKCAIAMANIFGTSQVALPGNKRCSTIPFLMMQCVRRSVLQYCPSPNPSSPEKCKGSGILRSCDFFQ